MAKKKVKKGRKVNPRSEHMMPGMPKKMKMSLTMPKTGKMK